MAHIERERGPVEGDGTPEVVQPLNEDPFDEMDPVALAAHEGQATDEEDTLPSNFGQVPPPEAPDLPPRKPGMAARPRLSATPSSFLIKRTAEAPIDAVESKDSEGPEDPEPTEPQPLDNGQEPPQPPDREGRHDEQPVEEPTPDATTDGGAGRPPDAPKPPTGSDDNGDGGERSWLDGEPPYVRDLEKQPRRSIESLTALQRGAIEIVHAAQTDTAQHEGNHYIALPNASIKYLVTTEQVPVTPATDESAEQETADTTEPAPPEGRELKIATIQKIKMIPSIRGQGIGTRLLGEATAELMLQGVDQVKGAADSVAAARAAFRIFDAENVEFYLPAQEEGGEETPLPMDPHQALASINRATERGGDASVGMKVDLQTFWRVKMEDRGHGLLDDDVIERGQRELEYYRFDSNVETLRESIQHMDDPAQHPNFIGQGGGEDDPTGLMIFWVDDRFSGWPQSERTNYVVRLAPRNVPPEQVAYIKEYESDRLAALGRARLMTEEFRKDVEQLVAAEPLTASETDKIPAVVTEYVPGDPLNEVPPSMLANVPAALERARAVIVDMAKHGIIPDTNVGRSVRWDGNRLRFVGYMLFGESDYDHGNLRQYHSRREAAKQAFRRLTEELGVQLESPYPEDNPRFRAAMAVWAELNTTFDQYWDES